MRPRARSKSSGFTLLEVMYVTAIVVVALGVFAGVLNNTSRLFYDCAKRLELNARVRMFTDRFAKETIDANSFYVLPDYAALNGTVDLIGEDATNTNKPIPSGQSGDCLVLEYRSDEDRPAAITRLRIIYRDTLDTTASAPIRHIDTAVPSGQQLQSLNAIINSLPVTSTLPSTHGSNRALVTYQVSGIVPLSESDIQPIFFNHANRAVSVNFRMQTEGTDVGPARRSASAYNFTISPRR